MRDEGCRTRARIRGLRKGPVGFLRGRGCRRKGLCQCTGWNSSYVVHLSVTSIVEYPPPDDSLIVQVRYTNRTRLIWSQLFTLTPKLVLRDFPNSNLFSEGASEVKFSNPRAVTPDAVRSCRMPNPTVGLF